MSDAERIPLFNILTPLIPFFIFLGLSRFMFVIPLLVCIALFPNLLYPRLERRFDDSLG
jgi:hypothetical protein